MPLKKDFSPIEKQIEILKEKNLKFRDEESAKIKLLKTNYYKLINGYREPFATKDKEGRSKYVDNIYFEEIYDFYIYELNLKVLFLKYIFLIEQHLKSSISYEFSKKYGPEDYLKVVNFDNSSYANTKEVFYLFSTLHNTVSKSLTKDDYISYYAENYNYIPLWVLANSMTLGNIINFFKLMKENEKEYIANNYFKQVHYDLQDYFEVINSFRNICAHDERLYNYRVRNKSIPDNKVHNHLKIKNKDIAKNDVFSLFISLLLLLEKDDALRFYYEFIELKKQYMDNKINDVIIEKIMNIMGFVYNFEDVTKII